MNNKETNKELRKPNAEVYDISNAKKISWEFKECKWELENLPKGAMLIIPYENSYDFLVWVVSH